MGNLPDLVPPWSMLPLVNEDTKLFPAPTMAALSDTYSHKDGRVIHRGPNTLAGVQSTLDDAEAEGPYTVAYFPPGTYDVGNGLSLSGRTAQIQGAGAGRHETDAGGTKFYASTQTGPVIDFTGWVPPVGEDAELFTGKIFHGGFSVYGSNVADPTKVKSGVRLTKMSSAIFREISVHNTGGPAWEHVSSPGDAVYLCEFDSIILNTPVGALANDVPYMYLNESNGCRFRNIGFRAVSGSDDTGASGALVIEGNATYTGYDLLFDGCWFEYLHVANGGCLINAKVNTSAFHDTGWHDCSKNAGATGTAHMRLAVPTVQDYGGNIVSGLIPGNGGTSTEIDAGIVITQSGNRVTGVRGFRQSNVVIASGVQRTLVDLGGTQSNPATATGPAVVDSSSNTTNVILDSTATTGYKVNRLEPAVIVLGTSLLQGSGAQMHHYGDLVRLYDHAGTGGGVLQFGTGALIRTGLGSPEGVYFGAVGSLYLRTDGGAGTTLYVKESGTGNTGWAAK